MPPKTITSKTACWFLPKPIIANAAIAAKVAASIVRMGTTQKQENLTRKKSPVNNRTFYFLLFYYFTLFYSVATTEA